MTAAIAALMIFFRMLRKQRPEPLPVELMLSSAEGSVKAGNNASTLTPELLNELIRQKPANVGNALRDWVTARKN